jgi:hypothetical protein
MCVEVCLAIRDTCTQMKIGQREVGYGYSTKITCVCLDRHVKYNNFDASTFIFAIYVYNTYTNVSVPRVRRNNRTSACVFSVQRKCARPCEYSVVGDSLWWGDDFFLTLCEPWELSIIILHFICTVASSLLLLLLLFNVLSLCEINLPSHNFSPIHIFYGNNITYLIIVYALMNIFRHEKPNGQTPLRHRRIHTAALFTYSTICSFFRFIVFRLISAYYCLLYYMDSFGLL